MASLFSAQPGRGEFRFALMLGYTNAYLIKKIRIVPKPKDKPETV